MGGDYYFGKDAGRSQATAAGTTAGTSATIAAATGFSWHATGAQFSGDAAALVTIESPSATVIWRKRYAAAFADSVAFPLGCMKGAGDGAILVKISASTAACEANIQAMKITT